MASSPSSVDLEIHKPHPYPTVPERPPALELKHDLPDRMTAFKGSNPYLETPLQSALDHPSDTVSLLSTYSLDNENERTTGRSLRAGTGSRLPSRSPAPKRTWRTKIKAFWQRNRGVALVAAAMLFSSLMAMTARLLETPYEGVNGMNPFQILFFRMTITIALSAVYMWWAEVPHPFGVREVRGLLVARGTGGFLGVVGFYYSLAYLPIAEATVITFLAPMVASCACALFLKEPYTRTQQIGGLVSLVGVVIIAKPFSFLAHGSSPTQQPGTGNSTANATTGTDSDDLHKVTSVMRAIAVAMGLLGVCGAAFAYTVIRKIGKRAHPLVSVNYFAIWTAIISIIAMLAIPSIGFHTPSNLRQWGLLLALGTCGFFTQFLLTAGMSHDKSPRALNMLYMQELFALALDKLVMGTTPGAWSIVGSSAILGGALYAVLGDHADVEKPERTDEESGLVHNEDLRMGNMESVNTEGRGLLASQDNQAEEDEERQG